MYTMSPKGRLGGVAFPTLIDHGSLFLIENLRGIKLGSPMHTEFPFCLSPLTSSQGAVVRIRLLGPWVPLTVNKDAMWPLVTATFAVSPPLPGERN